MDGLMFFLLAIIPLIAPWIWLNSMLDKNPGIPDVSHRIVSIWIDDQGNFLSKDPPLAYGGVTGIGYDFRHVGMIYRGLMLVVKNGALVWVDIPFEDRFLPPQERMARYTFREKWSCYV